jgi:bifunctional DNA-binding transcriptional regulator/antitoxin component of YhaV-PrlF toxin-antitoxin module
MERLISINEQGNLTLPKELRAKYGLDKGGQVVIEEHAGGLLIRACATFPIEIYSDQRVEDFNQANEDDLAGFKLS